MTVRRLKNRQFGSQALAAVVVSLVVLVAASSGPAYTRAAKAQANATTITLSPSPATLTGCDAVTVSVMINDVAGLYGADVRLAFDPNLLEVVDANGAQSGIQSTPGGFLTGSLFTVSTPPIIPWGQSAMPPHRSARPSRSPAPARC